MEQKCHAIVLRHADYGEYDRMVTLLTPDEGIISASMKGCKRPAAKLRHASELFCFGEYVLMRNGDRAIVKGCTMHDMFYPLREDLFKLTYASYMLSLAEINARSENPSEIFLLLLHTLKAMAYGDKPVSSLMAYYLIRSVNICGYTPVFDVCASCGGEGPRCFSIARNGLVCRRCASTEATLLSDEAINALKKAPTLTEPEELELSKDDAAMLIEVLINYISRKNERTQKSAKMVLDLCRL